MRQILKKITDWVSGWPLDKVLHYIAGYVLMSIFLSASPQDFKWAVIWTFFVALIAMGKEVIDMLRDGKKSGFDFLDVLWTLAGSTSCALVLCIVPLIWQVE